MQNILACHLLFMQVWETLNINDGDNLLIWKIEAVSESFIGETVILR